MRRYFGPPWFYVAGLVFALAVVAGAVGPDWLTPLLIAPAGLVIIRGTWPIATNAAAARTFAETYTSGHRWPLVQRLTTPFSRLWGAVGLLVGVGWFVGGIAGFVQQAF